MAVVLLIPSTAFADSHNIPPISVSTELSLYGNMDNVIVTGNIKDYDSYSGGALAFFIISPINDLVTIGQIIPNSAGSFEFNFVAGGPLWKINGDYTVQVKYDGNTSETTIIYTGGSTPEPKPEPEPEPEPEPTSQSTPESTCGAGTELVNGICQVIKTEPGELQSLASFVDESKDPQSYVDRYNNEDNYKEWFNENFPQYSSIYEAVGLEKPIMDSEPTTMELQELVCGAGTVLKNGICVVDKNMSKYDVNNFGLVVGQSVKYNVSFDSSSTNEFVDAVIQQGISSADDDIDITKVKTIEIKIAKILPTNVVIEKRIVMDDNSIFTVTSTEYFETLDFWSFFIPIDIHSGDMLLEHTENLFLEAQTTTTKKYDGKTFTVWKTFASDETNDFTKFEYTAFYDEKTGILFESKMVATIFHPLLGGSLVTYQFNAIDVGMPIEKSSKGGGCLIATATYGSELAPQVQQLRELRDNSLLQTESGTSFMNTFNDVYYSFSPIIADYERENPVFKEMVKIAITPMITSLSILNYVDMDSEIEVLGYGISLIILNVMMYVGIPILAIMKIRK